VQRSWTIKPRREIRRSEFKSEMGPDVSEEDDPALTTVSTSTTSKDPTIDSIVPTGPVDSNLTTAAFVAIDSGSTTSMANAEKPTSIAQGILPTEPNYPTGSMSNNPYATQAGIEPDNLDEYRAEVVPVGTDLPGCGTTAPVACLPAPVALVVSIVLLLCRSTLSAVSDRRVNAHNGDGRAANALRLRLPVTNAEARRSSRRDRGPYPASPDLGLRRAVTDHLQPKTRRTNPISRNRCAPHKDNSRLKLRRILALIRDLTRRLAQGRVGSDGIIGYSSASAIGVRI
jgi:hypothetical protein